MKTSVLIGLLVIILTFCFIGCDNDGSSNNSNGNNNNGNNSNTGSLVGTTWVQKRPGTNDTHTIQFISTSTGIYIIDETGYYYSENFSYTRSGNTVTFLLGGVQITGTISGNQLTFTGNNGDVIFTKE